MTAKSYLQQYRESQRRTHAISAHLRELRETAENLRGERGQRVALDAAVAELTDAQEETASELNRLCALRSEIIGTIDSLPNDKHRTLLLLRYINGMTWDQTADAMGVQVRQATRIHGEALKRVAAVLKEESA